MKRVIELRERVKSKKPEFIRQESWRYKRVKENWRKPKGIDSKMRKEVKGWPARAKVGYRGPKAARGLHPSAYREVIVYNIDDLTEIDPKTDAIRIAHTVGAKKRAEILNKAKEIGVNILNPGAVTEKEASEVTKVSQS
ncbi:MAG: 50S ribosomal protein L32e [Candidatus Bathyarchaeia archaeon]|nr:50S ribosomal protein L32e [Candidatus Bathyarchaeota archaeon]